MSRSPKEVSKLFAYTWWANARVLATVKTLTPDEFGRQLGGSFPSVRETLAHIYGADWVWLERWHGRSPTAMPPDQDAPTLEALREKWTLVEEKQKAFLAKVTESLLEKTISYKSFKGDPFSRPLGEALVHLVNHSTYHRGQVVTLLRQLGKTVQATDYTLFLDGYKG